MRGDVLVFGAGGHGKVVADAAASSGWNVVAFGDDAQDKRGTTLLGVPVEAIGLEEAIQYCRTRQLRPVVGVGSNSVRKRLFLALVAAGLTPATIVHRASTLAPSVTVGAGTVVFAGVIVNVDSVIGDNVILNTGATIDHDNRIESHAHVSPGAHLGGTVVVGEGTHIGIGSTIRNDITLGDWSVIGAGSTVVQDLPRRIVAYGVPARVRRTSC